MAAGSLLALFDDIATLLDDISAMSKVAAQKTAGILGDDLAVNAEKVSGVRAQRELPVVWAVTKGSLLNKLIIVPAVLIVSVLLPWLITPVLMVGGIYLCFEGAEKIWHTYKHRAATQHTETRAMLHTQHSDLVALEKDKIKGAIRTDFILSLEIIVIALSAVADAPFVKQCLVVSIVALGVTVVVYGLVAIIVKIDDLGLYLLKFNTLAKAIGRFLLWLAPALMKTLSIVGTAAMFLVGGGILTHAIEHYLPRLISLSSETYSAYSWINGLAHIGINAAVGLIVGAIALYLFNLIKTQELQEPQEIHEHKEPH